MVFKTAFGALVAAILISFLMTVAVGNAQAPLADEIPATSSSAPTPSGDGGLEWG